MKRFFEIAICTIIILAVCLCSKVSASQSTSTAQTTGGVVYKYLTGAYLDARNATSGLASATISAVGQKPAAEFGIYRLFYRFPLPEMVSCSACTLFINGNSNSSTTDFAIHVYGANAVRPTIANDDFIKFDGWQASGTYDSTNVMNLPWHSASYSDPVWNKIIFNSTGLDSVVAASGDTLWIALVSNRDVRADEPSANEFITFEYSSNTPYLSYTYESPEPPAAPTVTTSAASYVSSTTAVLNGNITATGGSNSSIRGFEWDIDSGAPYANDIHSDGSFGVEAYSLTATLPTKTMIYARAYATNETGTGYGEEVSFYTGELGIVLGNSTIAAYAGQNDVSYYLVTHADTLNGMTVKSLAVPGASIAGQRTTFSSAIGTTKYDWIVIEVGLNDLDPAESAATALGRYQTLIDTVSTHQNTGGIIVLSTMTPCKAQLITLYGETDGLVSYQKWLDMNDAIMGNGANAITGTDYQINSHTAALNDGSGNLDAAYDTGDHVHENNAGRIIIAAVWRAVLNQAGYLGGLANKTRFTLKDIDVTPLKDENGIAPLK